MQITFFLRDKFFNSLHKFLQPDFSNTLTYSVFVLYSCKICASLNDIDLSYYFIKDIHIVSNKTWR